jgi:SAM-dependent methyltransferase
MSDAKPKVLNVGGGSKKVAIPPYFADFEHCLLDIDPRGHPDVCCDARDLTTLEPDQFDAIYCSHNLEHYYAHDVKRVLQGFLHVLKPGGFVEIRVPDIGWLMQECVAKGLDIDDVVYTSGRGPIRVRDMLYGFGPEIESTGQDFYAHKTGFSQKSLARVLSQAGFGQCVLRKGRPREVLIYGFTPEPSAAQKQLLDLRYAPQAGAATE